MALKSIRTILKWSYKNSCLLLSFYVCTFGCVSSNFLSTYGGPNKSIVHNFEYIKKSDSDRIIKQLKTNQELNDPMLISALFSSFGAAGDFSNISGIKNKNGFSLLAEELGKLPDFQNEINSNEITALAQFAQDYAEIKDAVHASFDLMYSVGIPAARKYNSMLEALMWLYLDKKGIQAKSVLINYDNETLLDVTFRTQNSYSFKKYRMELLIEHCKDPTLKNHLLKMGEQFSSEWTDLAYLTDMTFKNQPTKFDYKKVKQKLNEFNRLITERWSDFDRIVYRLNAPILIVKFAQNYLSYDYERQERLKMGDNVQGKSPYQTFKSKKGHCNDQSRFALYCLLSNGYSYYNLFGRNKSAAICLRGYLSESKKAVGHVTCLYKDRSEFLYILDATKGTIEGPLNSIEEAADETYSPWKKFVFLNIHNEITYGPVLKYK